MMRGLTSLRREPPRSVWCPVRSLPGREASAPSNEELELEDQGFDVPGLRQDVPRACPVRLEALAPRWRSSGQEDDRGSRVDLLERAKARHQLRTRHVGEGSVDENGVSGDCRGDLEGLRASIGTGGPKPRGAEEALEGARRPLLVVPDQDEREVVVQWNRVGHNASTGSAEAGYVCILMQVACLGPGRDADAAPSFRGGRCGKSPKLMGGSGTFFGDAARFWLMQYYVVDWQRFVDRSICLPDRTIHAP